MKNAATRANQKSAGAGKGATSPPAGGSKKSTKSLAPASAAANATSDDRAAVKDQEEAKAADDAKMELELAKIRARALLYADKQQDRELEDAIAITE